MHMTVEHEPESSPPFREGPNIQLILRDFYLSQIQKAKNKVEISKARMEVLRKALEAANDALTEVSSLLIRVPETSDNAKLRDYAAKNPDAFKKTQGSLVKYQIVVAQLLYPSPGAPGTSTRTVDGRQRAFYDPPFTGVRLPDLSHLLPKIATAAAREFFPGDLGAYLPAQDTAMAGGPTTVNLFDPSKSDGASVSKTVKVLQAEIQALNQSFQMESSDAASALSTQNSISEGSKTATDKCFRVLADCLGIRS